MARSAASPPRPLRRRDLYGVIFWLAYAAAWLAYAALYVPVIMMTYGSSPGWAAASALSNAIPAALLGMAVKPWVARLSRRNVRLSLALLLHVLAAFAYSAAWYVGVGLALGVQRGLADGRWAPAWLSGPGAEWQLFQGLVVYGLLAGVFAALRAAVDVRAQESRANEAERLRVTAELHALRAQLSPHFLFNTLHSLGALIRHDPAAAQKAVEWLGNALRYVLAAGRDQHDLVTLQEEWEFARDYLELEQLRLAERLRVDARIDPAALGCTLPRLTLQPLLENALKHGIAPRSRGGHVGIAAELENGDLLVDVWDDGPGSSADQATSSGLGLNLVRQRLRAAYGERASMRTDTSPGSGFRVTLRLPAVVSEHEPTQET